ncbi:MAG: YidH family protein [Spirulinaceae cyanobacterium]
MTPQPETPPPIDRQREHQANERTFLAWLRTAISLIGFGFAIARFGLFLQQFQATFELSEPPISPFLTSETLGVGLAIAGIVIIALALWNYNRVYHQIEQTRYQPNRLLVWLTGGFVILLGVLSLPLILLRQPMVKPPSTSSPVEVPLDNNYIPFFWRKQRRKKRRRYR